MYDNQQMERPLSLFLLGCFIVVLCEYHELSPAVVSVEVREPWAQIRQAWADDQNRRSTDGWYRTVVG